jgi:16S rRNA (cytosine967-C5)-methyltransferase
MALLQRRLLDALWPLLRPGGRMVYCTCSVFLEENEKNIAAFVAATADARVEPSPFPFAQPPWQPTPHGFQILPGDADMDGFYYACLTRNGEPG